jgi:hypothetical protein
MVVLVDQVVFRIIAELLDGHRHAVMIAAVGCLDISTRGNCSFERARGRARARK